MNPFTVFSNLTSTVKYIIMAVVLVIILIIGWKIHNAWDSIYGWFGGDTKATLQEKLKDANQATQTAVDANKTLQAGNEIQRDGEVIRTEVQNEKVEKDTKVKRNTEEIKAQAQFQVQQVVHDVRLDEKARTDATSKIRIMAIWKAFCKTDDTPPKCVELKAQGEL